MVRIIMHGCNGKMGQVITGLVADDPNAQIVAGIDIADNRDNGYPVFTDIKKCDVAADVIVDFAAAVAVDALLDYSVEKQIPVVLCTTGLSDEQLAKVKECSAKVAILKSANMSLGINTLMKLLKDAANVFAPAGYDIEIVEKHHNQKVDAPSGTAIALADSINEARGGEYEYVYDRSQVRKKRDKKELIVVVPGATPRILPIVYEIPSTVIVPPETVAMDVSSDDQDSVFLVAVSGVTFVFTTVSLSIYATTFV